MLRDVWRRVILPRLAKWWGRIAGLPKQMEGLEIGLIVTTVMMTCWLGGFPPGGEGSPVTQVLFALCPRRVWVGCLWLNVAVGTLGFLEEITWMRRWANALAGLFWWLTGAYLLVHLHVANPILPRLMMLTGVFCALTWTFVAQSRIKHAYRHGEAVPARLWWLTGR